MKVSDHILHEQTDPNLIICQEAAEYEAARTLIQEYADSLDIDLSFDHFDYEISHLENHYSPPTGMILLIKDGDEFMGCLCIRSLGHFIAEIKRMYVRPGNRGKGLGRRLLQRAISEAKGMGYRFLRLDTIPDMKSAIQLFQSMGFYEIEDYRYNPIAGAQFMEYKL